jgi:hypothetical protein
MELLLNLAWLLLALPAYWLWRDSRTVSRKFRPSHSLLALACMLVVLFPVISATDDLHAMRAEMEESPSTKRNISQTSSDRSTAGKCHPQLALTQGTISFVATEWGWYHPLASLVSLPTVAVVSSPGRAPPALPLA